MVREAWGPRIRDALVAACHPRDPLATSVREMGIAGLPAPWRMSGAVPIEVASGTALAAERAAGLNVDAWVVPLCRRGGQSLVRLARLFVDDRNAAEDLVQEAFIRLARSAHRIEDEERAAAYLRSIVINLARDHNRRGLVSFRHRPPAAPGAPSAEEHATETEGRQEVVEAL